MHATHKGEKYDDVNDTELIELCRQRGILSARHGLSRKTLLKALRGEISDQDLPPDPLDDSRDMMQYMMQAYPDASRQQLRCADEQFFCPECPVGRVVACSVVNIKKDVRKSMMREMILAWRR